MELLGNSKLDISGIGGEFNANSLNAEKGSLIILNRETGLMKIKDVFTGTVIFKPFFIQEKLHIQELTGTVKQWIVTEEVYDEKLIH